MSRQLVPVGVTAMAVASVIVSVGVSGAAAPYLWAATGLVGSLLALLALRERSGLRRWTLAIAVVAGLSIVYWVFFEWPFHGASDPGAVFAAWMSAIVMGICGIVTVLASGFGNDADGRVPQDITPNG